MKEKITPNEIEFLLMTAAYEESMLVEIHWEFEKWDCDTYTVLTVLSKLIQSDNILISKFKGVQFEDLSKEASLEYSSCWQSLETNGYIFFLTDKGEKKWEDEDFGITTKRAKYLMFSNHGRITRV